MTSLLICGKRFLLIKLWTRSLLNAPSIRGYFQAYELLLYHIINSLVRDQLQIPDEGQFVSFYIVEMLTKLCIDAEV